ncbi:MAG: exodeoxyribonuclease VII small subunit [Pseudomonadota bacterium]
MAKDPKTSESTVPADIARMSFEEALEGLETIVRALEKGDGKLDDAISSYERGTALRKHCEAKLRDAEVKIARITEGQTGGLETAPLDGG